MDLVTFITENFKDLSLSRLAESTFLLFIIWRKLRPHLERVEARLAGLELAVQKGFDSGEHRFTKIEERIQIIELKTATTPIGVTHEKPVFS